MRIAEIFWSKSLTYVSQYKNGEKMRNKSIDIARAGLIFYIITIIHGIFWLNIIPQTYGSLLLFEMPLIFVISGYAYALFEKKSGFVLNIKNYISFVISRGSRILIPYLVYVICCSFIVMLLDNKESPADIIAILLDWLNPVSFGRGYSFEMLNLHLWFIKPFLMVTFLLPIVTKFYPLRTPIWLTGIGLCIIISTMSVDQEGLFTLITAIFYLFWAYLGYILTSHLKIKRIQCIVLSLLGIFVLVLSEFFLPVTLNMQSNKFPPNWLFFVFSSIWLSLFLLVFSGINHRKIEFLASSTCFKPFIANGYSIYLWQGMGYTAANVIGSKINLSIFFVWLLATVITVLLGIIFGPLERIRLRLGAVKI